MKVWIDLSNSPHPLFFAPVARGLEADGHEVLVTARDNAQTVELTLERWPDAEVIGGQSPRRRAAKVRTLARRIGDLRRWAIGAHPDVAVSHNSYAQIVASRSVGIPAVTAMDFEHQPANHLAFRLARTVLVPEALPSTVLRRQGAHAHKVIRYPGFKEELYIGDFEPDTEILRKVGIGPRPKIVVVIRTPPNRAVYHPSANPLFEDALRLVCGQPHVACIALTRHPEQLAAIESMDMPNCIIPTSAIDARSLMYAADAMVGAGGTMTREAALLGIPTWTLFAGTAPAVDVLLEQRGLLKRLQHPDQLGQLRPRATPPRSLAELRVRGQAIGRTLAHATLAARER